MAPTFDGTIENDSAQNATPLITLFRAELAALASYGVLLAQQLGSSGLVDALRREKTHHADRAVAVHARLREVRARIPTSEGAWASLGDLGAVRVGAVLSRVHAEEVRLLEDYRASIPFLDSVSRRMVRLLLLPAQSQTVTQIDRLRAVIDG
jgi:hypothetical protein